VKDWSHLIVEEHGNVLRVGINRATARNALNTALMTELTEIARLHRRSSTIRAIVLHGTNDFFSAGMDLKSVRTEREATATTLLETRAAIMAGPDMCKAWEEIEVPTIAAIEGFCVGGAVSLALACDFRIMGKSGFARLPEVPLGMNMSWRTLPKLAAMIGPSRAKRFAMFGESTPAKQCVEWGLVDEIVEDGKALETGLEWATRLAALPPIPVQMTKEAINMAVGATHHATTFMDRDQFLLTYKSDDVKEGVAAWFEKRSPKFKGN